MTEAIRWGILGTGMIAHKFADGLAALPDAQLVAVGSRTAEGAATFADQYHIPRRHASYEALAADPQVDAIYVSTPHPFHCENTLLCLDHGKAVLCEKPFAINARESARMIERARAKGLFLMEAMWTRCLPVFARLNELLAEQVIGELRMVTADFGFRVDFDPVSRLFDPALGGGALLDVGIYPVSLAHLLFGPPSAIHALADIGQTGVDEQTAIIMRYPQGQLALLFTAVRLNTVHEAVITGTEGVIRIAPSWWVARRMVVSRVGQPDEVIEPPFVGNGYNYEAAEVMRCLRAGLVESPIMPLDETLVIMQVLDAIRAQWGLVYPTERA
jgi:predicted dehydrogenase